MHQKLLDGSVGKTLPVNPAGFKPQDPCDEGKKLLSQEMTLLITPEHLAHVGSPIHTQTHTYTIAYHAQ